jgi:hypothetical protein
MIKNIQLISFIAMAMISLSFSSPIVSNMQPIVNDKCSTFTCLNGGQPWQLGYNCACRCAVGFSGAACEIKMETTTTHPADPCAPLICLNNGMKVNSGYGGCFCKCQIGFYGSSCEYRNFLFLFLLFFISFILSN